MNRETLTDSLFRVVRMVLVLAVAWGVSATAESATLVSRSTTWRYLKGTREASDPRSEWRTIDFDDSSWMKGAAPFGYGETGLNTTFADMQGSYSSFFLRKTFSVSSLTPDTYLRIAADYDDGFIVWVNGERVWDKNEPDDVYDRPLHDSLARSSHEGGMFETNDVADAQDYLMLGENVVAVQVFNESLASSDAKLNLELSTLNRVADTQFSHDRGFYTAPFHVTISTKTAGATIQYTLNGSDPRTASSAKIINASSGSVLIDPDSGTDRLINGAKAPAVVLRAAAFKGGYEPTNADTHTYLFLQDVIRQGNTMAGEDWVEGEGSAERLNTEMDPEVINDSRYANRMADALVSIPTLSVAMDYGDLFGNSHGIYHNALEQGEAWERAASAELINHCGRKPLQVDCGIRLQGAGARHGSWCPKRSFKLYFREEYGAGRLQYPFFAGAPENADSASDRIDKLVLRAGANKTWVTNGRLDKEATVYARDQWHRDSQIAMSGIGSHGNFVHLYLNGLYWGLYNVAERPDHGFTSDYLGGAKEDWFACNHGIDRGEPPVDGDRARFDSMHSIAKRDDLNDAARYQLISTYLNITEFCDYIILHWFAGTGDWPENNWYAGHRMNPTPEPLMYFSWDAEDCFVDTDWFAVNRANAGAWVKPQFKSDQTDIKYKVITLWRALHRNTDFRTEFADRIYEHGFNGGALTDAKSKARWASICDHIELAILGESARWGDAKSGYIDYEPDGVDPNFPYNRDDHWYPARDAVTQMMTGNADRLVEACRAYSLHSAPVYPTIDPPNFNQHGGAIAAGFKLTMSNPNGVGAITYTLDGSDPRKAGGSRIGIPYAGPMTLSKTTHVRARVYKTNGTWSAVHAATFNFTAHYSRIRITEIMYNPIGGSDYEFIEITNTGSSTRGLSDMTLKGVRYTFAPGAQLEAGRIALLVANEGLFTNRYPAAKSQAAIFGVYAGKLDNDGERVALLDSEGNTVTSVRYNDKDPWPDEPDGDGYSLVAVDPDADPDNPANWRASNLIGGSPGYDDGVPYRVVINEVLSHTDPPQVDAIELHNAGATGVDLGGWYLSDAMGELKKFRIPNGTAIAAGGYCVFDEGDFNTDTNDPACFALSSHGDEVYLSKWDANGNLVYFAEQRFGGAANGVAFGRYQRTDGEEDFVAQSAPNTLGAANAYPAVGPVVINEIMHHPSDLSGTSELSDEFIELLNISDSTVKLYDTANPANTWKLSAAVDYTFPTGTELAPDEYALLVATNASTFRSQHAIPASIQILGPYTGRLNNSGESVKLWRPDTPDPDGIPWILVDRVDYNDNSPWPESADGDGPSLERQDPRAYGNDPANWAASLNAGGTPGVPNSGGLVSKTAGWTFHDRGIDLGTAWRAASYDDSGWNDGNAPLGYAHEEIDTTVDYGEDSTAKHITTYFRKVFTLAASPDNVTDLTLCARYDDGFVAYLNGQEVVRASLPTGTIGYGTTATSHEPAGFETFGITSHKSKLVKGLNVLAVEIHQSGGSSSDLFMDIELTHTAEAANPPAAPQNLTAASASSTRINLAWQDMSGNETRFKIRRSLDGVDFDTLPPVYPAANTTTYTDSGLSPGTTYWYIIRSENAAGTSPYTDPVSATTGAGTPAAPTALAATPVSTTQIDLTWTDNADNEEIYKVYRSPDGSVWARIGTLSANTTAYSDAGLSAATAYSYKVRCENAAGDSGYTAVVRTATQADLDSFTAYNDLAWFSGQTSGNITTYTTTNAFAAGVDSGLLVDHTTGQLLPVRLQVAGGSGVIESQGLPPAAGTDAYGVFAGKVDATGTISYGADDLTLTFTGMDPALRYELVLYGDRNRGSYVGDSARYHHGTLSGATSFQNASTPGTTILTETTANDTTHYNAGYNNPATAGYVTRFKNVDPGADGRVVLRVKQDAANGCYSYANALLLRAAKAEAPEEKIAKGATWTYRKGTSEASTPATAWRGVRFDDAGWAAGPAPIGYGASQATTLDDMYGSYSCVFLRKRFTIEQPATVTALELNADYDDGFIVWLNGQEIARVNVEGEPGDSVACDAFAASNLNASWSNTFAGTTVPALLATNVLAVQVFNRSLTSGDLAFDAQLSIVNCQLSIQADADQDGMPDAWEDAQLADLADPADRSDSADPDGDGLSNIEEYIAGTDPTGTASCFAVDLQLAGANVVVSVPTVPAIGAGYEGKTRYYALQHTPAPNDGAWLTVSGYEKQAGNGQPFSFTNMLPNGVTFYRARVWLETN